MNRTTFMVQPVLKLLEMLASHTGMSVPVPTALFPIQPANTAGEAAEDRPNSCTLTTYVGNLNRVLASWLQLGPAPAVTTIRGVKQMKDSLPFPVTIYMSSIITI